MCKKMATLGITEEESFSEVTTKYGSSALVLSTHFKEETTAYEGTSEVFSTSDEGKGIHFTTEGYLSAS